MWQMVAFVRAVPEISCLSSADQRAVIAISLHRLLLLFMAESNVHFVVAPVLQSTDVERVASAESHQQVLVVAPSAEPRGPRPTMCVVYCLPLSPPLHSYFIHGVLMPLQILSPPKHYISCFLESSIQYITMIKLDIAS